VWNVKAMILAPSVSPEACYDHFKGMCLDDIPGKHSIAELQKAAIVGTAHILSKVLT
jgi:hypothetical protein